MFRSPSSAGNTIWTLAQRVAQARTLVRLALNPLLDGLGEMYERAARPETDARQDGSAPGPANALTPPRPRVPVSQRGSCLDDDTSVESYSVEARSRVPGDERDSSGSEDTASGDATSNRSLDLCVSSEAAQTSLEPSSVSRRSPSVYVSSSPSFLSAPGEDPTDSESEVAQSRSPSVHAPSVPSAVEQNIICAAAPSGVDPASASRTPSPGAKLPRVSARPVPHLPGEQMGLFAEQGIKRGTMVGWYTGKVYETEEALEAAHARYGEGLCREKSYVFEVKNPEHREQTLYLIDANEPVTPGGELCDARLINHSNNHNCVFKVRKCPDAPHGYGVAVVTQQIVRKNDELTVYYGESYAQILREQYPDTADNDFRKRAQKKRPREEVARMVAPPALNAGGATNSGDALDIDAAEVMLLLQDVRPMRRRLNKQANQVPKSSLVGLLLEAATTIDRMPQALPADAAVTDDAIADATMTDAPPAETSTPPAETSTPPADDVATAQAASSSPESFGRADRSPSLASAAEAGSPRVASGSPAAAPSTAAADMADGSRFAPADAASRSALQAALQHGDMGALEQMLGANSQLDAATRQIFICRLADDPSSVATLTSLFGRLRDAAFMSAVLTQWIIKSGDAPEQTVDRLKAVASEFAADLQQAVSFDNAAVLRFAVEFNREAPLLYLLKLASPTLSAADAAALMQTAAKFSDASVVKSLLGALLPRHRAAVKGSEVVSAFADFGHAASLAAYVDAMGGQQAVLNALRANGSTAKELKDWQQRLSHAKAHNATAFCPDELGQRFVQSADTSIPRLDAIINEARQAVGQEGVDALLRRYLADALVRAAYVGRADIIRGLGVHEAVGIKRCRAALKLTPGYGDMLIQGARQHGGFETLQEATGLVPSKARKRKMT